MGIQLPYRIEFLPNINVKPLYRKTTTGLKNNWALLCAIKLQIRANKIMSIIDRSSVISTNFYHINVDSASKNKIKTDLNNLDLEIYLETLLVEVHNKEQSRLFNLTGETTAFNSAINEISKTKALDANQVGEKLAERLLQKEIATDKRYGHLSAKDTHVKVGSFLQFTYTEKGQLRYLGVKVDHQVILDESDFKRRAGLGLSEKIYKAFRVDFNDKKEPSRISIYDSKSKLTRYWWHDFLELKEANTDTFNTKLACEQVIAKIGVLKKDFPQDHTILRNATVAAFKQNKEMDYVKFVDETFTNYTSQSPNFDTKKDLLISKLKELPIKKGFDTLFKLIPSAVPFRQTTYKLNQDISLVIKEGIENLDAKIWRETTVDGRELVVIETSEAKNFVLKTRAP